MMGVRYWVLIEPGTRESMARPGGLFRVRTDETGQYPELLVGAERWRVQPSLAAYFLEGEPGAAPISEERALALERTYPWPGARKQKVRVRDNPNHDELGRFATGDGASAASNTKSLLSALPTDKEGVAAWEQKYGERARAYEAAVNQWTFNGSGLATTERQLGPFLDQAPTYDHPLYRGTSAVKLDPGYEFQLNPSSFTTQEGTGERYARDAAAYGHPTVLEVQPGARGLPVGPFTQYPEEHEVISGGKFVVVKSEMRTMPTWGDPLTYQHLVVRQV